MNSNNERIQQSDSKRPKGNNDNNNHELIQISGLSLSCAVIPLLVLALACWYIGLVTLSSSIVSGCVRTFLQLTLLGSLLRPIFTWGERYFGLVVLYITFMIVLASYEATSRTKYVFENQFSVVLASLFFNVMWVSILAFGIILRRNVTGNDSSSSNNNNNNSTTLYNPRYVIPIIGMLLGNSISAVALSLDAMTRSFVEQQSEIELYLSFGATQYEATHRIVTNAIQIGATPVCNMMRVIGIISIPGMMTGQILGGSNVATAARYQMLIVYLIALCTLGVVLVNAWMALHVGFDTSHHVLRTERFVVNEQPSVTVLLAGLIGSLPQYLTERQQTPNITGIVKGNPLNDVSNHTILQDQMRKLQIRSLKESCTSEKNGRGPLRVEGIRKSFDTRLLFQDVSLNVTDGDMLLVSGPSGVGKSTLLRMIAGLTPIEDDDKASGKESIGTLYLGEHSWHEEYRGSASADWRRQVRYVTQSKVDIPGTPRDFISRITSFQSWKNEKIQHPPNDNDESKLTQRTLAYLTQWGLGHNDDSSALSQGVSSTKDFLQREWSKLSGGEAQRVIVALALPSKPQVLLFDESTSALDKNTKIAVENSVKDFVHNAEGAVLWISHDEEQAHRMSSSTVYPQN